MGQDLMSVDPGLVQALDAVTRLWPGLLLACLIMLALGVWLGRATSPKPQDKAEAIWEAINKAAKAALVADAADLPGKAEALRQVLDARLAASTRLIGGQSGLYTALVSALEGRADEAHHTDAGHGAHDTEAHADDGHGHSATVPAGATVSTAQVVVFASGSPGHDHGTAPQHLSPRAREQALLLAVAALSQHWRQKAARLAELRAAWRELSAL